MPAGTYILYSCPLLEVSERHYSTAPTQDVLPSRTMVASSLVQLTAALAAYKRDLDATGRPYYASVMKHRRCPARKISGFDKARERGGALAAILGNQHALANAAA